MQRLPEGEIGRAVLGFLGRSDTGELDLSRTPGREQSFDFVFNYFQETPEPSRDLELSCMQLGYYLASWGMLRGSTYLLQHTNARHYVPAIEVIEAWTPQLRGLDLDAYDDPVKRRLILDAYTELRRVLLPPEREATTLVTKVMLGVWGVIPAFDTFFIDTFRRLANGNTKDAAAFRKVSDRSLALLGEFYIDHQFEIDGLATSIQTVDFATSQLSGRSITRAKVVDMYGFQAADSKGA